MPSITIDGRSIDAPPGTTVLQAARSLGIAIPALCHAEGYACGTSCMVCVVKVVGIDRLLPACATVVAEGQAVCTDTPEVLESRRMALELLLSEHAGDCEGPCRGACPAAMDIPVMLRAVQQGQWDAAWQVSQAALVLPETLGYVCPSPCEKACRRAHHDGAVAIRALHREAARRRPGVAEVPPVSSGKRVAVVGAGPTGLAVVRELARHGHACHLLDSAEAPGGALRTALDEAALPRAVLAAEAQAVTALLGVTCHWRTPLRDQEHLAELAEAYDAVVLAFGADLELAQQLGLQMTGHGIGADRHSGQTSEPNVYAAGGTVAPIRRMAVRAIAAGTHVAKAVHGRLAGAPVPTHELLPNVRLGRLTTEEMALCVRNANGAASALPATVGPLNEADARAEALRCLHCDCRASHDCRLRQQAGVCGASPRAFEGPRREVAIDDTHAELIYESGKCISCGLCIQEAKRQGERYGLTFERRGFAVRMAPALGHSLAEAIHGAARSYADLCPTGALSLR